MSVCVDIKKKMGNFLLQVKFSSEAGILGLLGASGCGKSMTLKCIAGIVRPDEGRIVINGRTVFDSEKKINLPPQMRKTGYLFQNYALFPHMTVAENIAVGISCAGAEKKQRIRHQIETFYLEGLEERYPGQLSGGQQQRVALARMLASDPEIIMLDEPFSALDSHLKWQIEMETTRFLEQYKGSILFVSHSRDEIYRLCHTIAVISDGKIEEICDKNEMFAAPRTLAASKLTGCKNHSRAEKTGAYEIRATDWGCILKTAVPVEDHIQYVGIRAHYLEASQNNEGENQMPVEISRIIEDPFGVMVVVKNPEQQNAEELVWMLPKEKGQEIQKGIVPNALHLPPEKLLLLY